MSNENVIEITIDSKRDVLDLKKGSVLAGKSMPPAPSGFKGYPIKPGRYQVSYKSNITYRGSDLPMNKCILYNTTDGNPKGWFYLLEHDVPHQSINIDGKGDHAGYIWAFVIDISSADNQGTGTVTMKKIG